MNDAYPCARLPALGASIIAVPFAPRFTCVVEPPADGTVSGAPASLTKLTGNETGEPVRFVKYSAEYQPPPNANCGRTLGREPDTALLVVVGMEVKASPSKRSPSTATLPDETENCAEPRCPTMPLSPGRLRRVAAVLLLGGRAIEEVPMVLPFSSHSVTFTVLAVELGFTTDTAVTRVVSSQASVFDVTPAPDSGTTAS